MVGAKTTIVTRDLTRIWAFGRVFASGWPDAIGIAGKIHRRVLRPSQTS